jgi:hypothetical protein
MVLDRQGFGNSSAGKRIIHSALDRMVAVTQYIKQENRE